MLLEIIENEGFAGLYSGLAPALVLCVNPALQYGTFALMRLALEGKTQPASSARIGERALREAIKDFLYGAVSKIVSTSVTYPLLTMRTELASVEVAGETGLVAEEGSAPNKSAAFSSGPVSPTTTLVVTGTPPVNEEARLSKARQLRISRLSLARKVDGSCPSPVAGRKELLRRGLKKASTERRKRPPKTRLGGPHSPQRSLRPGPSPSFQQRRQRSALAAAASNNSSRTFLTAARSIYSNGGIAAFYTGIYSKLWQTSIASGLLFAFRLSMLRALRVLRVLKEGGR